ncbi:MAG TPA: 2-polyprenyl-3-methyl-6-methoxy-1,4-benzoquinone monooxygenase [Casimicrobiaceae bacterium]
MATTPARIDEWIGAFDRALRTLAGVTASARPVPGAAIADDVMSADERGHAAALMRVNHAGEVCAQALYSAQALCARDDATRLLHANAAREEADHLAWTSQRLDELGSRPSLANPLWYAGSFAIGALTSLAGDRSNLGFVVETERQVEEHLGRQLERLPADDAKSRAIVEQMRADEARHGAMALEAGAAPLPWPVRHAMRRCADLLRAVAYRV